MGDYTYISFDPGAGKKQSIGVVCWDKTPKPIRFNQFTLDELHEFLKIIGEHEDQIKTFIVENYVVDPSVPHGGSEVGTIRTIGALQYHAKAHGIDFVLQPNTILPMAEKWSGQKMIQRPNMREMTSAFLHGHYYLTKNGLLKLRVLTEELE